MHKAGAMIIDSEANLVFVSALLEQRYPAFYSRLTKEFEATGIEYKLLPNTKDIWVRDFMPIQTGEDVFVQFKFDPDYLKQKKYGHLVTDPLTVNDVLNISVRYSLFYPKAGWWQCYQG